MRFVCCSILFYATQLLFVFSVECFGQHRKFKNSYLYLNESKEKKALNNYFYIIIDYFKILANAVLNINDSIVDFFAIGKLLLELKTDLF